MTDKVQKICEEVKKLKSQLLRGACSSQIAMETRCKEESYNEVLAILDSLQEEPVSEDLEKAYEKYADERLEIIRPDIYDSSYSRSTKMTLDLFDGYELETAFEEGAKWQKTKDESTTEDLGEYINELSKQFPEVSFAKLSRIAVRVAKWQLWQIDEILLSEVLPCFMHGGEADEVVAKLDEVLNRKK